MIKLQSDDRQSIDLRVNRSRGSIIRKTEPVPVVASPFVEDTLVASVPGAFRLKKFRKLLKLLFPGCENQDSRVEDVGPTDVQPLRDAHSRRFRHHDTREYTGLVL